MKGADPIDFGNRVRERRIELGFSQGQLAEMSGYSQSNIGWIESGSAKKPHKQVVPLADALWTSQEYLLWGTGIKETGRPIMTDREIAENYKLLTVEERQTITEAMANLLASLKEKRKRR